jgi:hypothetical protein
MFIIFEFISGFSVGIEIVTKKELGEGEGWFILLELGIIRLIFEK